MCRLVTANKQEEYFGKVSLVKHLLAGAKEQAKRTAALTLLADYVEQLDEYVLSKGIDKFAKQMQLVFTALFASKQKHIPPEHCKLMARLVYLVGKRNLLFCVNEVLLTYLPPKAHTSSVQKAVLLDGLGQLAACSETAACIADYRVGSVVYGLWAQAQVKEGYLLSSLLSCTSYIAHPDQTEVAGMFKTVARLAVTNQDPNIAEASALALQRHALGMPGYSLAAAFYHLLALLQTRSLYQLTEFARCVKILTELTAAVVEALKEGELVFEGQHSVGDDFAAVRQHLEACYIMWMAHPDQQVQAQVQRLLLDFSHPLIRRLETLSRNALPSSRPLLDVLSLLLKSASQPPDCGPERVFSFSTAASPVVVLTHLPCQRRRSVQLDAALSSLAPVLEECEDKHAHDAAGASHNANAASKASSRVHQHDAYSSCTPVSSSSSSSAASSATASAASVTLAPALEALFEQGEYAQEFAGVINWAWANLLQSAGPELLSPAAHALSPAHRRILQHKLTFLCKALYMTPSLQSAINAQPERKTAGLKERLGSLSLKTQLEPELAPLPGDTGVCPLSAFPLAAGDVKFFLFLLNKALHRSVSKDLLGGSAGVAGAVVEGEDEPRARATLSDLQAMAVGFASKVHGSVAPELCRVLKADMLAHMQRNRKKVASAKVKTIAGELFYLDAPVLSTLVGLYERLSPQDYYASHDTLTAALDDMVNWYLDAAQKIPHVLAAQSQGVKLCILQILLRWVEYRTAPVSLQLAASHSAQHTSKPEALSRRASLLQLVASRLLLDCAAPSDGHGQLADRTAVQVVAALINMGELSYPPAQDGQGGADFVSLEAMLRFGLRMGVRGNHTKDEVEKLFFALLEMNPGLFVPFMRASLPEAHQSHVSAILAMNQAQHEPAANSSSLPLLPSSPTHAVGASLASLPSPLAHAERAAGATDWTEHEEPALNLRDFFLLNQTQARLAYASLTFALPSPPLARAGSVVRSQQGSPSVDKAAEHMHHHHQQQQHHHQQQQELEPIGEDSVYTPASARKGKQQQHQHGGLTVDTHAHPSSPPSARAAQRAASRPNDKFANEKEKKTCYRLALFFLKALQQNLAAHFAEWTFDPPATSSAANAAIHMHEHSGTAGLVHPSTVLLLALLHLLSPDPSFRDLALHIVHTLANPSRSHLALSSGLIMPRLSTGTQTDLSLAHRYSAALAARDEHLPLLPALMHQASVFAPFLVLSARLELLRMLAPWLRQTLSLVYHAKLAAQAEAYGQATRGSVSSKETDASRLLLLPGTDGSLALKSVVHSLLLLTKEVWPHAPKYRQVGYLVENAWFSLLHVVPGQDGGADVSRAAHTVVALLTGLYAQTLRREAGLSDQSGQGNMVLRVEEEEEEEEGEEGEETEEIEETEEEEEDVFEDQHEQAQEELAEQAEGWQQHAGANSWLHQLIDCAPNVRPGRRGNEQTELSVQERAALTLYLMGGQRDPEAAVGYSTLCANRYRADRHAQGLLKQVVCLLLQSGGGQAVLRQLTARLRHYSPLAATMRPAALTRGRSLQQHARTGSAAKQQQQEQLVKESPTVGERTAFQLLGAVVADRNARVLSSVEVLLTNAVVLFGDQDHAHLCLSQLSLLLLDRPTVTDTAQFVQELCRRYPGVARRWAALCRHWMVHSKDCTIRAKTIELYSSVVGAPLAYGAGRKVLAETMTTIVDALVNWDPLSLVQLVSLLTQTPDTFSAPQTQPCTLSRERWQALCALGGCLLALQKPDLYLLGAQLLQHCLSAPAGKASPQQLHLKWLQQLGNFFSSHAALRQSLGPAVGPAGPQGKDDQTGPAVTASQLLLKGSCASFTSEANLSLLFTLAESYHALGVPLPQNPLVLDALLLTVHRLSRAVRVLNDFIVERAERLRQRLLVFRTRQPLPAAQRDALVAQEQKQGELQRRLAAQNKQKAPSNAIEQLQLVVAALEPAARAVRLLHALLRAPAAPEQQAAQGTQNSTADAARTQKGGLGREEEEVKAYLARQRLTEQNEELAALAVQLAAVGSALLKGLLEEGLRDSWSPHSLLIQAKISPQTLRQQQSELKSLLQLGRDAMAQAEKAGGGLGGPARAQRVARMEKVAPKLDTEAIVMGLMSSLNSAFRRAGFDHLVNALLHMLQEAGRETAALGWGEALMLLFKHLIATSSERPREAQFPAICHVLVDNCRTTDERAQQTALQVAIEFVLRNQGVHHSFYRNLLNFLRPRTVQQVAAGAGEVPPAESRVGSEGRLALLETKSSLHLWLGSGERGQRLLMSDADSRKADLHARRIAEAHTLPLIQLLRPQKKRATHRDQSALNSDDEDDDDEPLNAGTANPAAASHRKSEKKADAAGDAGDEGDEQDEQDEDEEEDAPLIIRRSPQTSQSASSSTAKPAGKTLNYVADDRPEEAKLQGKPMHVHLPHSGTGHREKEGEAPVQAPVLLSSESFTVADMIQSVASPSCTSAAMSITVTSPAEQPPAAASHAPPASSASAAAAAPSSSALPVPHASVSGQQQQHQFSASATLAKMAAARVQARRQTAENIARSSPSSSQNKALSQDDAAENEKQLSALQEGEPPITPTPALRHKGSVSSAFKNMTPASEWSPPPPPPVPFHSQNTTPVSTHAQPATSEPQCSDSLPPPPAAAPAASSFSPSTSVTPADAASFSCPSSSSFAPPGSSLVSSASSSGPTFSYIEEQPAEKVEHPLPAVPAASSTHHRERLPPLPVSPPLLATPSVSSAQHHSLTASAGHDSEGPSMSTFSPVTAAIMETMSMHQQQEGRWDEHDQQHVESSYGKDCTPVPLTFTTLKDVEEISGRTRGRTETVRLPQDGGRQRRRAEAPSFGALLTAPSPQPAGKSPSREETDQLLVALRDMAAETEEEAEREDQSLPVNPDFNETRLPERGRSANVPEPASQEQEQEELPQQSQGEHSRAAETKDNGKKPPLRPPFTRNGPPAVSEAVEEAEKPRQAEVVCATKSSPGPASTPTTRAQDKSKKISPGQTAAAVANALKRNEMFRSVLTDLMDHSDDENVDDEEENALENSSKAGGEEPEEGANSRLAAPFFKSRKAAPVYKAAAPVQPAAQARSPFATRRNLVLPKNQPPATAEQLAAQHASAGTPAGSPQGSPPPASAATADPSLSAQALSAVQELVAPETPAPRGWTLPEATPSTHLPRSSYVTPTLRGSVSVLHSAHTTPSQEPMASVSGISSTTPTAARAPRQLRPAALTTPSSSLLVPATPAARLSSAKKRTANNSTLRRAFTRRARTGQNLATPVNNKQQLLDTDEDLGNLTLPASAGPVIASPFTVSKAAAVPSTPPDPSAAEAAPAAVVIVAPTSTTAATPSTATAEAAPASSVRRGPPRMPPPHSKIVAAVAVSARHNALPLPVPPGRGAHRRPPSFQPHPANQATATRPKATGAGGKENDAAGFLATELFAKGKEVRVLKPSELKAQREAAKKQRQEVQTARESPQSSKLNASPAAQSSNANASPATWSSSGSPGLSVKHSPAASAASLPPFLKSSPMSPNLPPNPSRSSPHSSASKRKRVDVVVSNSPSPTPLPPPPDTPQSATKSGSRSASATKSGSRSVRKSTGSVKKGKVLRPLKVSDFEAACESDSEDLLPPKRAEPNLARRISRLEETFAQEDPMDLPPPPMGA
eukprot:g30867.t1